MARRLLISFAVLVTAACDCGGKTHNLIPAIQVLEADGMTARSTVDFGFVQVGVKGVRETRITGKLDAFIAMCCLSSMPDQHPIALRRYHE